MNNSNPPASFLRPLGGYRKLRVCKVTEMACDITYHFAHTYLVKGGRSIDQMVLAARSGKQNIAERSEAATASRETEMKQQQQFLQEGGIREQMTRARLNYRNDNPK